MRVAEIRELQGKDTFVVKNIGLYPVVGVESGDVPAVGLAGARLLTETSRVTGLGDELSRVLSAWRRWWAVHDPGKIILDLAVCVALGGRCLSDLSLLRCDKEVFGSVASDPTVSRLASIFHWLVEWGLVASLPVSWLGLCRLGVTACRVSSRGGRAFPGAGGFFLQDRGGQEAGAVCLTEPVGPESCSVRSAGGR